MEKSVEDLDSFTVVGTNIDEVISQNERSGLTFKDLNKIFEEEENVDQQVENKKNQQ